MKGFAFVLLCALVAVQGRHTGELSGRAPAALGENPWLVHLRIAVETSGNLDTCTGSLIDNRWVLTSASCLSGSRFIWIRYGAVDVIRPSLVTESSQIRIHPGYNSTTNENNVGLIDINRIVEFTETHSPVSLLGESSDSVTFCGYGATEDGKPGEQLICSQVALVEQEDGSLAFNGNGVEATKFDVGAPLVSDGVQVGIVTGAANENSAASVVGVTPYLSWIEEHTGLNLNPEPVPEVAPEAVRVVN